MRPVIRAFVFILLIISFAGCSYTRKDLLFVNNAELSALPDHIANIEMGKQLKEISIPPEFVITGHRISKGDGVVLAFREFKTGGFIADQSQFTKISVFLPYSRLTAGETIDLSKQRTIAYLSKGASNFPGKSGCYGYANQGVAKIIKVTDEKIEVKIDALFTLWSPSKWKGECSSFSLSNDLVFNRIYYDELKPWDGIASEHIYDESMPP